MRYDTRRDRTGWTVFDRWTGQTVVLGRCEQAGLSPEAANAVLWRIGGRSAAEGGADILQGHAPSWPDVSSGAAR